MPNPFVAYVCPAIGNVLGIFMLLTPIPAVLRAKRSQSLGALNVLPYPLTAMNCIGWLAYGLVIPDLWIIPGNLVGTCAGLWFTMSVLPLMDRKSQDRMTALTVGSAGYFVLLSVIGMFALDSAGRIQMWGMQSLVVLLLYYGMPLSTMWEVIKTRNAASIYPPLALAAIANGGLWTLYGLFAAHDFNMWFPNLVGVILAVVQMALRLFYGVVENPHLPVAQCADRPAEHEVERSANSDLSRGMSSFQSARGASDPHMMLLANHKALSGPAIYSSRFGLGVPMPSVDFTSVDLTGSKPDSDLNGQHEPAEDAIKASTHPSSG